jgi:hypothetical protein
MDPRTWFLIYVNAYAANLLKNQTPVNLYPILSRARIVSEAEMFNAQGPEPAAWDFVAHFAGLATRPEWLAFTPEEQRVRQALGGRY